MISEKKHNCYNSLSIDFFVKSFKTNNIDVVKAVNAALILPTE